MTNKIYIDWNNFHKDAKLLAQKLKTYGNFSRIVAVSRGGFIPAGIIAYELGIRHCDAVCIASYDAEIKRNDNNVELGTALQNVDENTVIIDDLADSGRTLQILRKQYPQATFACVYAKPAGQKFCDVYACPMADSWVVFPWD